MSKYYNPKNTRNIFKPESKEPFRLSRSKIELFIDCPRCFYLDRRLGTGRPPGFPFSLNSAVDTLLKKEFDIHRAKGAPHPLKNTALMQFLFNILKWMNGEIRLRAWRITISRLIFMYSVRLTMCG